VSAVDAQARDRSILYATAVLRAVTTSLIGVMIGVYLARLGIDGAAIGTIISAGLFGAVSAATIATFFADRIGRRRYLIVLAASSVAGTVAFALLDGPIALGAAAFVGMLNGMGRDRGAALILEQASLSGTTTAHRRTQAIAWYTMLQDLGHAAGALLAGLPTLVAASGSASELHAHRLGLMLCAVLGIIAIVLYARLGRAVEAGAGSGRFVVSARSRAIVVKISGLFAIDSVAGGFLTTALLSYFFFKRFGVNEAAIGGLFFGARLLNAGSHLGAAWLARRIGLVNTMVFTHIPSSLLLVTVAFAPNFAVAAVLFLLREGLVEMDVPTRQSYVLAVVAPEERTFASGVTNLVRLAGWAVAPVLAGALMSGDSMVLPLIVGAGMKIAYDLLLWRAFRGVHPPEEDATGA
jgi:MFS family permease